MNMLVSVLIIDFERVICFVHGDESTVGFPVDRKCWKTIEPALLKPDAFKVASAVFEDKDKRRVVGLKACQPASGRDGKAAFFDLYRPAGL
jgi:hypothetical protein